MPNNNHNNDDFENLPESIKEFLRKIQELNGEDVEIEFIYEDEETEEDPDALNLSKDIDKLFAEREESLELQNARMENLYSAISKIHNMNLNSRDKQLIAFAYGVGLIDGGIK
jgi:hypothetical protein